MISGNRIKTLIISSVIPEWFRLILQESIQILEISHVNNNRTNETHRRPPGRKGNGNNMSIQHRGSNLLLKSFCYF